MAKHMSVREKKERAAIRKELREAGVIPPTKKPLNRKRFRDEAVEMLESMNYITDGPYIVWALAMMMNHTGGTGKLNLEAVGAAKVIKLAAAKRDFEKERREKGETSYTLGELIEATKEIYMA